MKTLDRSRPFGTIHPMHQGAAFAQDGLYFDAQGHQCGATSAAPVTRGPGRPRKQPLDEAPTTLPVNPELAAQLADGED